MRMSAVITHFQCVTCVIIGLVHVHTKLLIVIEIVSVLYVVYKSGKCQI